MVLVRELFIVHVEQKDDCNGLEWSNGGRECVIHCKRGTK